MLKKQYDIVNFIEVDSRWYRATIMANEYCSTMGIPGEENVQIICDHAESWANALSGQKVADVIIKKVERAVEAERNVNLRSQYHDFLERLSGASGPSVLHIMGQPGSGTTILSEHIIELLRSNNNANPILASFTVAGVSSASGLSHTIEMLVTLSRQFLLLKPEAFRGCSLLCSWK
ncbi:hypothetical protein F5B22DRAFT_652747 [Xylaria bambusicola]|uniref:uncharacterized protein n=1 Tax=Xylaria bambusicola TaxID=326684 RepID=UPI0020081C12|nr:uncharacterized protein F5B22DRAFT_652747 [Xylaria bambusicola]KAI0502782.1 hypothetical protein F5B22DRAFT_652747 [Xylaria bambusicola]